MKMPNVLNVFAQSSPSVMINYSSVNTNISQTVKLCCLYLYVAALNNSAFSISNYKVHV